MNDKICYIVCAGEKTPLNFSKSENDVLIVADGGYKYLNELNQLCDILVGDFDSINKIPSGVNVKKLNVEKDETDTFVCVEEGLKKGCNKFYIYCGTGGRVDHTIANVQTLIYLAKKNIYAYLFTNNGQVITAIPENKALTFSEKAKGTISFFATEKEVCGVNINGLKYGLKNGTLSNSFPLAISNSFIGKNSSVYAEKGVLLAVFLAENINNIT